MWPLANLGAEVAVRTCACTDSPFQELAGIAGGAPEGDFDLEDLGVHGEGCLLEERERDRDLVPPRNPFWRANLQTVLHSICVTGTISRCTPSSCFSR